MYHAIVVGARCAGSSTAMLLARRVLSPENVGRIVTTASGVESRPTTEPFERSSPCM